MIFTPLVSPAVTPLEAQFAMPEYTVPGAYLSPLTSPALEAQHPTSHRAVYHQASRSDTSVASSPIEMLDATSPAAAAAALASVTSQPTSAKKVRRASITGRPAARVVRQSPAMKPQRRTNTLQAARAGRDRGELMSVARTMPDSLDARSRMAAPPQLQTQRQQANSSGSDSISPEPLAEALMPPPPAPDATGSIASPPSRVDHGDATSSPVVVDTSMPDTSRGVGSGSGNGSGSGGGSKMHPATPASLMRLANGSARARPARGPRLTLSAKSDGKNVASSVQPAPELSPLTLRTPAVAIETPEADGQTTPTTASAQRTPTLASLTTTPTTTSQSPIHSATAVKPKPSPITSSAVENGVDPKSGSGGARGVKKRTNSTSVQVSPALRPKISPSIKPLLPEGGEQSWSS